MIAKECGSLRSQDRTLTAHDAVSSAVQALAFALVRLAPHLTRDVARSCDSSPPTLPQALDCTYS
eukprot:6589988-Prymnesium_polylepis.2